MNKHSNIKLRGTGCLAIIAMVAASLALVSIGYTNSTLWSQGIPTVGTNVGEIPHDDSSISYKCESTFNSHSEIASVSNWGMNEGCVIGKSKYLNLLAFDGGMATAVKIGGDTSYYYIDNLQCKYNAGRDTFNPTCLYLESQDILVARESPTPGSTYTHRADKLIVYENFSGRLTRKIPPPYDPGYVEYTLNKTDPDFILEDKDGTYIPTRSVNNSRDGGWLAVEMEEYGMLRINTATWDVRKVFDITTQSTASVNVAIESAISDDGSTIAAAGSVSASLDPDFAVYDIDTTCGRAVDLATEDTTSIYDDLTTPCPYYEQASSVQSIITNFHYAAVPRFLDEEGKELSIYAYPHYAHHPSAWVVLHAPNYVEERLNYLALGDSYSSGEGDTYIDPSTNKKRYRAYTDVEENQSTNQPREKCHISTQSYPYKLAQSFSWALADQNNTDERWQTVACSGAVIHDIDRDNSDGYEGQYSGKGSTAFGRLHGYNVSQLQATALNEMIPGREKQIEFVKKYKPRAVTLTMGGNDVDFAAKITDCISSTPCDMVTDEGKRSLGNEIKSQYSSMISLYEEIKQGSPGVKIYVLGYPQVISNNPNANIYCPLGIGALDASERKVITEGYAYMNDVIEAAAQTTGVMFIDVENALDGHKLCGSINGSTYVTGLAWFMRSDVQETLHPNADGHSAIANTVWDAIGDDSLLSYSGYPSSPTAVSMPQSTYLQTTISPSVTTRTKKMTDTISTRGQTINIWTNLYTFLGGSQLALTLHSDPVSLGGVTVASNGSLDTNVAIPSTVPPGYHTLVVSGQTPSGEPIEYKQLVLVKGEDPDDIDDDGVSDDQQACGPFVMPANEDADYDGIDDACDPEITSPVLYVARNGDVNRGEDQDRLYIYRNTRASSITGITADYVDTSTNQDNKEALVAQSLDSTTSATYNRFIMLGDDSNPNIKVPTILAKDATNTCTALQPIDYLSPALNPADPNYAPRGFTKLTQLPAGEDCD